MTAHETTGAALQEVARNRIREKSEYWFGLAVLGVISALLVTIWAVTSPGGYFWPLWPIAGMAVAALLSAASLHQRRMSDSVSSDLIEQEIRRLQIR